MNTITQLSSDKLFVGLTFMVVDDNTDIAVLAERMLRARGARQVWRETGVKQAMASVSTTHTSPSLILSDNRMSPLTGLQFLQAIRMGINKYIPRDTPFVLMTGFSEVGTVTTARELDVQGFVAKPASIQTMVQAIQKALSQKFTLKSPESYRAVKLNN
jgi:CheY-like chemotaxis protein